MTVRTWAESTEVSARSKARKRALDLLFEAEQRGINADALLTERMARPATQHDLNDYTVETGYEMQVPLFVEQGTKVKVDTRSGDYLGRVS